MANNLEVKSLVNKLIVTHLEKGVQPEELSGALFEDEYEEFTISKIRQKDSLIVKLSFYDFDSDIPVLHKFRYSYELSSRTLLRVEQAVGKARFTVQWDRAKTIQSLCDLIKSHVTIEDFRSLYLDELPNDLSSKFYLAA